MENKKHIDELLDNISAAVEMMLLYRQLMNEFCDRVESGDNMVVQSAYSRFCRVLGRENKTLKS
jgi:hypothetical protein